MTTETGDSDNPEKLEQDINAVIRVMWAEKESARDIAIRLTADGYPLTRNAVLGRIYRMRQKLMMERASTFVAKPTLPPEKPVLLRHLAKRFIPDRVVKRENIEAKIQKMAETEGVDTGEGVSLMDIRRGQCKYVLDFTRNGVAVFCGETEHKGSYCEKHYRECYYKPSGKIPFVPKTTD